MGFMTNKEWSETIDKMWRVDDIIAVLQLKPVIKNMKKNKRPIYKLRKMTKKKSAQDKTKTAEKQRNDRGVVRIYKVGGGGGVH